MSSLCEYSSEFSTNLRNDPLDALHNHVLATDQDLDVSILTDDELVELLKKAKDPKELSFLNMNLAKNSQSSDGDVGKYPLRVFYEGTVAIIVFNEIFRAT